jgi:hypothetical protein
MHGLSDTAAEVASIALLARGFIRDVLRLSDNGIVLNETCAVLEGEARVCDYQTVGCDEDHSMQHISLFFLKQGWVETYTPSRPLNMG